MQSEFKPVNASSVSRMFEYRVELPDNRPWWVRFWKAFIG